MSKKLNNVVITKVNHTNPGKKEEYHGQFLGSSKPAEVPETDQANFSGVDSRVKPHETSGPEVGATMHSQMQSRGGASPNRVRHAEAKLIKENGSTHLAHVHNAK